MTFTVEMRKMRPTQEGRMVSPKATQPVSNRTWASKSKGPGPLRPEISVSLSVSVSPFVSNGL